MSKHRHYEMIVAQAANIELVQFIKINKKWEVCGEYDKNLINFHSANDFFLCLPQHKKECIHFLNGGDVQFEYEGGWVDCDPSTEWNAEKWCMLDRFNSRIKPKKVKRVIGVNIKTGQTTFAYELDNEGNYAKDEVRLAIKGNISNWQFIEIELEG